MLIFHTLQGSRMGLQFNSRPLTPPIVDPRRFWFLELLFYLEICNFRQDQIFTDHMEVGTWKAWCPSLLAPSKVPGILVIGKRIIFGQRKLTHLKFPKHGNLDLFIYWGS